MKLNILQRTALNLLGLNKLSENTITRALHEYGIPIATADNKESYVDNGYALNADLYTVISWLAEKCASVPFSLYKKNGEDLERIHDHPILELLNSKPNALQGAGEFKQQMYGWKFITGDSYVYGTKLDSNGKIVDLFTLPASQMQIIGSDIIQKGMGCEPIGYRWTYSGQLIDFNVSEVMHVKYPNYQVDNGGDLYGMSPIKAALWLLTKSNANYQAGASNFQNSGAKGILFDKNEVSSWSEIQAQSTQNNVNKKINGTDKRGTVAASVGNLGYINLGLSPADLQLLEDAKFNLERFCNVYHVNPNIFTTSSTYNNIETARKISFTDAVIPQVEQMVDELQRWLVPTYGNDLVLSYDVSNIEELQADKEKQANWLFKANWLTYNEKREAMGMSRIDDETMDEIYIPSNMFPIDMEDETQLNKTNEWYKDNGVRY